MRQRRMQMFEPSDSESYDAMEDVNPSAYLVNMADCMLVMACGLMVALVVAWNVTLPSATEVIEGEKLSEVDNMEEITDPQSESGNSYIELGSVYQDPATGKLYMITDQGSAEAEAEDRGAGDESGASNG